MLTAFCCACFPHHERIFEPMMQRVFIHEIAQPRNRKIFLQTNFLDE